MGYRQQNRLIKDLRRTSAICPAQWTAETLDGRPVYIRYRYDTLMVLIADKQVFYQEGWSGDAYAGWMETTEMLKRTGLRVIA